MAWLLSPFRGFGGFGFGPFGGKKHIRGWGGLDDDRVDRSNFNETSAVADRRLEECKSLVRGQDFTGENEHRVVTFDPNSHLVDANWSKLGKWLRELPVPLVAVRVKATPQQIKNQKISRKTAYFVSVARTKADASAAAKASAAQANAPKSTTTTSAASSSSSSSSSAMNVAAAVAEAPSTAPSKATQSNKATQSKASSSTSAITDHAAMLAQAGQTKAMKKLSKASARPVSKSKSSTTKPADKVKKTPSAYILYCTDKRSEVKLSHPDATFGELGVLLGKIWQAMDVKDKAPYEQLALTKKYEQQQQQQQQQHNNIQQQPAASAQ